MVNAEEIAYWNAVAGTKWVQFQERLDAIFAPITAAAIASAKVRPNEAVLDIGCGCGETVIQLAHLVGRRGSVLGVDVSKPMLEFARSRVRMAHLENVSLELADASAHPFEAQTYDLMFSRFGVMFFDDPSHAFANMRRALHRSGRIAFVCWRSLGENPFFYVPRSAALEVVEAPPKPDPEAPGPVSFGDPDRVRRILKTSGYRDVWIEAFDTPVALGKRADAVEFFMNVGPASTLLHDADDAGRTMAGERINAALASHETPSGIVLGAAVWLVCASL